jgi:hypothetical protein
MKRKHFSLALLLILAPLLCSCGLVDSVARTGKSVLGIRDPEPPRNFSAMPENEWEATWKGERDDLLMELRGLKRGDAE